MNSMISTIGLTENQQRTTLQLEHQTPINDITGDLQLINGTTQSIR